jgi:hypothetical protein
MTLTRVQFVALSYVGCLLVGSVLVGWAMYRHLTPRTVTTTVDGVPTVLVPKASLSGRDVAPYVAPTTAAIVNTATKQGKTVQAVAQVVATLRPVGTSQQVPTINNDQPAPLTQQIGATAISTTDKSGQPGLRLDLFTIADGTWTPIPNAKSVVIAAQPQKPRWRLGLALQAGGGLTSTIGIKPVKAAAAVIALPWLRRGTGPTAEQTSWSLFSPALVVAGNSAEPGVLPFTYNIARHVPLLADVHVGPVVSRGKTGALRVGVVMVATF